MYCRISLNRPTVDPQGQLFKLSHLKFEIHAVMHLSQRRLQTCCQNQADKRLFHKKTSHVGYVT